MRVAVTPANIWRRGRILICGLQCRGAGCKGITLLDRAFDEFQATFMLEVTATQLPPWRATLITWTIYPPHRLLYSSDNHLNGAGTLEHGCGRHEPRPGASMVRSRAPYHGPSIFNSWAAPMVPEMVSSVCQSRSPQHQMLSFWLVSAKKKQNVTTANFSQPTRRRAPESPGGTSRAIPRQSKSYTACLADVLWTEAVSVPRMVLV